MRFNSTLRRVVLVGTGLAVAAAVASCGGHDDGNQSSPPAATTTTNVPPASAAASVSGFIAFMKTVVAVQLDMSQPLDVSNFVAPTSDTTLPDPTI